MATNKNKYVLSNYQTCTSGHKLYIIMPLMSAGSLSSIINFKYPQGIKDETIIATIMKFCLLGIKSLHNKKLIHRDIKCGNILLDLDGRVALADFGVATHFDGKVKKTSFVGSFCWMAPEVISNIGYDYKVM